MKLFDAYNCRSLASAWYWLEGFTYHRGRIPRRKPFSNRLHENG